MNERRDKAESDVEQDEKVASSRAGKNDEHGSYVGQTASDDAIDAEETGAEARSDDRNR